MAASAQAPHLTTVVPAAALTEAYRGLHKGGVHYNGGWHTTVVGYEASTLFPRTTEARRAGWLETLQASPQCLADNHAGTTPPGAYTPYYQERDFRALGAKVNASVFVTQGFLDGAVKPDNFGAWFENVPTAKKAWLGFWYHQYPTAANAGRDDMYLAFHRWFDSELKGIDNGIHDGPVVEVQDSLGGWRGEEAWPPRDATRTAFALSADGALTAPEAAQEGRLSFGGPASAADLLLRGGQGRLRVSTQLASDMHIAGVPRLNVTFVPQGPEAQVIARVWDGDRLVTQGALNLLYTSDPSSPRPVVPGTPVRALLELYPTDWVLQAGRTLTLELSTVDAYGWFDEGTAATVAVQTGPEATLELPTVVRSADDRFLVSCGAALRDEVPGCFLDLADRGV
jgi:predicted acyl esterase